MRRDSADSKLVFSADDLVLFRNSPFASWMERLTLENPHHGIPPDDNASSPAASARPQNVFAATLRANNRRFVQIDWEAAQAQRATATLEAMRKGMDFIVDGQLAVGPLSDGVNLLMRTSGFSELGDYLYLPCDTAGQYGADAAFRLCFQADLLHSLQGQLPPQLIEIRRGEELNAQETERHIHYYRAVKQRFMLAQRNFRKHRIPDPSESAECGRWYACANEVLRQRLHQRQRQELKADVSRAEPADNGGAAETVSAAAQAMPASAVQQVARAVGESPRWDQDRVQGGLTAELAGTLAEQARRMERNPPVASLRDERGPPARLQPLGFIAESPRETQVVDKPPAADDERELFSLQRPAPAPTLDTSEMASASESSSPVSQAPMVDPDIPAPHPLDSPGFSITAYRRVQPQSPSGQD